MIDGWSFLRSEIYNDFESRINEFFDPLEEEQKFKKNEISIIRKAYKMQTELKEESFKSICIRQKKLLQYIGCLIRDTRFWASQLELMLFSKIFNKHMFLFSADTNNKWNKLKEREWSLQFSGNSIFTMTPFPTVRNKRSNAFIALVEGEHFVNLKIVPFSDEKNDGTNLVSGSNKNDNQRKLGINTDYSSLKKILNDILEETNVTQEINDLENQSDPGIASTSSSIIDKSLTSIDGKTRMSGPMNILSTVKNVSKQIQKNDSNFDDFNENDEISLTTNDNLFRKFLNTTKKNGETPLFSDIILEKKDRG